MTITKHEGSTLALSAEQAYWTEAQIAALRHIGVEHAGEGDLQVFHHVCQRTGLDPFARQVYMIGRQVSEKGADGQWHKVVKQTIQTGIDGFRLIGRRAADRARHSVSVSAPEWAHEDGTWRPVWRKDWGYPVAARVTIQRAGQPFSAVALFDEYKQTKYGGDLTSMWEQRPAGQLAKCAEALAWRMAFPQDLSGIYTDDEMGQAENVVGEVVQPAQPRGIAAALQTSGAEVADSSPTMAGEPSAPEPLLLNTSSKLAKAMYAAINEAGITEAERMPYISGVIGRDIASSKEMFEDDARRVLRSLEVGDAEIVQGGEQA